MENQEKLLEEINQKLSFDLNFKRDEYVDGRMWIHLKSKKEVNEFYQCARERNDIVVKNFGGDEYNQNMYIIFENDIHLSPPSASNGDRSWSSYGENFGFDVKIY